MFYLAYVIGVMFKSRPKRHFVGVLYECVLKVNEKLRTKFSIGSFKFSRSLPANNMYSEIMPNKRFL